MYRRIYVDNDIVTFIKDIIFRKSQKNSLQVLMEKSSLVYLSNLQTVELEFLFSEEVLEEIQRGLSETKKRFELEAVWRAFKKGKKIIKNRKDLPVVKSFLESKGNDSLYDAQHIANAMLPENDVEIFMTNDDGIWRCKNEIESKFGVKVMKPSQLADYYKFFR